MSEEIEAGDENCIMMPAGKLTEEDKAVEESDVLLELKTIDHGDVKDSRESENVVVEDSEVSNEVILELDQMNALENIEEKDNVVVPKCFLKIKKRRSTIDVVNYDETTESSENSSLDCFPHENDELEDNDLDFRELAAGAMHHAEEIVRRMLLRVSWTICHFHALPKWLQDNDFIWQGYRPPLPSFWDCIKSIFSIHTETGNIWTHMLGQLLQNLFCFIHFMIFFSHSRQVVLHSLVWLDFFSAAQILKFVMKTSWFLRPFLPGPVCVWDCQHVFIRSSVTLNGQDSCSASWTMSE